MRRLPSLASLLFATAALAGCAVGPDYARPTIAAPAAFMGQAAVSGRQAPPAADISVWWQGFNDPALTRTVDRALAQNLDLSAAMARVRESRAALGAANAALLPSGQASAQGARAHLSEQTPLGRVLASNPDFDRDGSYYEADLGGSWEIDVAGGLRRGQEAARADFQASRADLAAARLAVAAQAADDYVVMRGLQARLSIARDQADTQRKLLATVELQYQKGLAAELQLRQAQGSLALTEAAIPLLENALEASLNALDVLMGQQPGTYRTEFQAPSPIPTAPAISAAVGPADLIRRRPDLMVAERRLAASSARIGEAQAEYYPKLSLSALLGTATTAGSGLFSGGANQAQGVLGLRWRLFDFGRLHAELAGAKGRNAEALAAYNLAVLRATEDVEDSFSTLVRREQEERTLGAGEASLTRARFSAFAAYKGGVVSLIEVLDADGRLLSLRDARALAQIESARAAIASYRALGGGWQAES